MMINEVNTMTTDLRSRGQKAAKPRISTGFKDDVKVKNPLIH